ncbi:biofilm peroxide resistance protein BsmA [Erwinia amylovora]|uniref:biofilm peroxide resistance protein BsmA n=1 Tax=Erwinia amylovora TaxID=552 RepID=UPI001443991B|nr:biofilm peroxide resistance protein BsmA [Erwinia amylovora]
MTYTKSYHSFEVMMMRKIAAVLITLLLSSCHSLYHSPQPLPAPTAQAQEIGRAQSTGLSRLGIVNVTIEGSPDDAGRALAARANAVGAPYYQILALSEKRRGGIWYGSAILYGPAGAATRAN